MKFILIYTTYKNAKEAQKVIGYLLKNKIIACANFLNINSQYRWKGKIENSKEILVILKTKTKNWNEVKKYIEDNHSYETPCIIKLAEVEANNSYSSWIENVTI